jgi:hypothetical protein
MAPLLFWRPIPEFEPSPASYAGTLEWRYRCIPEGSGTRVVESCTVTKPITALGWFLIGTVSGLKDRAGDLRAGMPETLDRLAAIAESPRIP